MDRNIQSIYINPNFKNTQKVLQPHEHSKTTHFNRHYLNELPSNRSNAEKDLNALKNRKIYVNPNFISVYNELQNIKCKQDKQPVNRTNENLNSDVISQQLYTSKYSLIKSVSNKSELKTATENTTAKEKINKVDMNKNEKNCIALQNSTKQNTCIQKHPLNKSRYRFVRNRSQVLYKATEHINICLPNTDLVTNKSKIPCDNSNLLNRYSNTQNVKSSEKSNQIYKTSDRVAKVKINKYKTVSVSYLKNNSLGNSNTTLKVVKQHPQIKRHSKTFASGMLKKNKYKFVKLNITPVTDNSLITSVSNMGHEKVRKICNENNVKLGTKFKLNNIPCRLFIKYGKCLRQDRGHCKYVHDKKHVSLCRKFLKGACHDSNCALSHELTDKKMPTCHFYLIGICTKEKCPYVHVKLNDKMKICEEFLKGYCENGDKCSFRHIKKKPSKLLAVRKTPKNIPTRSCSKNKITEKRNSKITKQERVKIKKSCEMTENISSDCRYYRDVDNNADVSCEVIKPTRCKLGSLPSFIQL